MKAMAALTAVFFIQITTLFAQNQSPQCWEIVGYWESDYFEYKGKDFTNDYQLKVRFHDDGNCEITLVKPKISLTHAFQYTKSAECKWIKIGDFTLKIEDFEWADELKVRYQSGTLPDGYITPWKAHLRFIE